MTFTPELYGYSMLSAVVLAFECILIGFFVPGRIRGKVFTKEFLKHNFNEIHYLNTKEDVHDQKGYPDIGSGFYSKKLSYADWLLFNRAQRVHLNFVEAIATYLILILVAGLQYPIQSAVCGFALCLGRLLFIGYMYRGGPRNLFRIIAVIICDLALLYLFILSLMTCSKYV